MKLFEQHAAPHPSSDNSDSEDLYGGFDTDELHPSSDSELVSHPSDSEGHGRSLSASPMPSYSTSLSTQSLETYGESDGDTDDEDQRLPSSSFSSQDFDRRFLPRRRREIKEQDDFLLVEPPSRPHSSLSSRSEDPMSLVFPSMVLSQPSMAPVLHDDDAQQVAVDKISRQDTLHIPPTHDIPTAIDSSLETLSGAPQPTVIHSEQQRRNINEQTEQNQASNKDQEKDRANNDSTDDLLPLSGTVELAPAQALAEEDKGLGGNAHDGVDSAQPVLNPQSVELSEATKEKSDEEEGRTEAQSSASVKDLFDHVSQNLSAHTGVRPGFVSINPSWSVVKVLAGCFGFLSLLIFSGYLAAEYHYSVQPAHVVVSEINYSEQSRLAIVLLEVYTSRLTQEQRPNRPPGFHIRVLNDNKPWSLEDAPVQPMHLFAEPIVSCVWGGYCRVYVSSLLKRSHKNQSPWLCSDTSYYLHIWFANGTRVSNTPPEIFTSRGEGGSKPRECLSRPSSTKSITDQGDADDVYDDNLAYLKDQLQHVADTVAESYSALSSSLAMWWDLLQPVLSQLRDLIQVAYDFSQYSAHIVTDALLQWKTLVVTHVNAPMDDVNAAIMRAQENAKKLKIRVSSKLQQLATQIHGQTAFMGKQQFSTFRKKIFKDQFDKPSAKKALRKADQLLHWAEQFLADVEDSVDSWVADKVDVDEIKRQADRLAYKAEAKFEEALDSDFARNINRNMKRKLSHFKTTPTGEKLVREANEVKKDVKRRWKDLQRHLGRW
ncbi:hypothetical protein EDD21DRAFT_116885 [Dissophora ornata]|nr:hypothetical protein BGZ58_002673 [Dissophora ornata]KAI8606658.1 hypothetical protein EDD21DRAFT_116885 [Dissophora ornata]